MHTEELPDVRILYVILCEMDTFFSDNAWYEFKRMKPQFNVYYFILCHIELGFHDEPWSCEDLFLCTECNLCEIPIDFQPGDDLHLWF